MLYRCKNFAHNQKEMNRIKTLLLLGVTLNLVVAFAQTALISQGSQWKYYDQGNINNPSWNTLTFDDTAWPAGNAELGYGDGDENTVVGYGPDANNKYITTYFRSTINVVDPSQFSHLTLNLKRDDGAVVYINGTEVWRSNMPGGAINFNTPSSGTVAWPNENNWYQTTVSASHLQVGNNVVAVEIHQENGGSSDISFNFSMIAEYTLTANVTRGPYLQKANQQSVILRWRTDVPTDSKVEYGISPALLNNQVVTPGFVTDHEVLITGLAPNTSYYYTIGSFSNVLEGGTNYYFETLPPEGAVGNYEFLVMGDCGTGYQEQTDVKNAVLNQYGNHFDGVLLLGDNAYQSGFDSEYQSNFFRYDEIFENTVIWPAPGNHDYNNHIPFSPPPAYFDIFNCPTNGECGGVPSGTEKYYSFNYGNIHFVSLDSYDEDRSAGAAMATWLLADLQANTQPWIVAFWHHPPYTKGSHDSDNDNFLDGELVEIREEILPIVEAYGVDLVLNGHSHTYERSMLIDGHYGYSGSFGPQHIKDSGSGNFPIDCPYEKDESQGVAHQGTVYTVLGNSGKTSSVDSEWPHPVMHSYSESEVGAIILKVNKNRLDVDFFTGQHTLFDHYTIVKNAGGQHDVVTCINEEVTLTPSWPLGASAVWNPGSLLAADYTISPLSNGTITASDVNGCITDEFNIVALQNDTCGYLTTNELKLKSDEFFATYSDSKLIIKQGSQLFDQFEVLSTTGKVLFTFNIGEKKEFETSIDLRSTGYYFVRPVGSNTSKIIYYHE